MRQVTKWINFDGTGEPDHSGDLDFAIKQIEKYGNNALIKDQIIDERKTGKRAVFRED